MQTQFQIGDRVARRRAPSRTLIITHMQDGQFLLSDEYGAPKGGAWSDDLVLA